jgi:hypothetical protein
MKKFILIPLTILLLSCNSASYIFDNPAQTTGVDFSKGKWLLNEVNVPSHLTKKITELAMKDFTEDLKERLSYAPDTKGLLLPQKEIRLNPDKSVLSNLYKGTGYDYFINIKAAESKNDFAALDLTNHHFKSGDKFRTSEVAIEIYDLKNSAILYSQKVVASVMQDKSSSDVTVSKPQYFLILSAYKRLIKDIDKKSIH